MTARYQLHACNTSMDFMYSLKIGCPREDGMTVRSLHIKKTVLHKKLLLADKVWLELVISTEMDKPTILCKQLPWPIKGSFLGDLCGRDRKSLIQPRAHIERPLSETCIFLVLKWGSSQDAGTGYISEFRTAAKTGF